MPQMAPISWLILFFIFSLAFMTFNILNYYCFFNKNSNDLQNKNMINLNNNNNKNNWKW